MMYQYKSLLSSLAILLLATFTHGQDEQLVYEDEIYLDYIKSVKLNHKNLFTSLPIIDLNSSGKLILTFDDLEGVDKEYTYEIVHCDKDWKKSNISEIEYLEGFSSEEIDDISFSINTYQEYSHYRLELPNDEITWKLSGNYLLKVYETEYDKTLAITRRFMVVEPLVDVNAEMVKPRSVPKIDSHHEISFEVDTKDLLVRNARSEIEVILMQNGRWDNMITGVEPKIVRNNLLQFNYIDRFNFPALKEFRSFDIRSMEYASGGVHSIDINQDGIDILLGLDVSRLDKPFNSSIDVNGNFVVQTRQYSRRSNNIVVSPGIPSADTNADALILRNLLQNVVNENDAQENVYADYANVIFGLDLRSELYEGDVYIIGKFTDWKLKEEYKLQFDSQNNIYVGEAFLKQGFYDYMYVLSTDRGTSLEALEGSWQETENDYNIFVYYSEFGSRYDRLIGLANLNSNLIEINGGRN